MICAPSGTSIPQGPDQSIEIKKWSSQVSNRHKYMALIATHTNIPNIWMGFLSNLHSIRWVAPQPSINELTWIGSCSSSSAIHPSTTMSPKVSGTKNEGTVPDAVLFWGWDFCSHKPYIQRTYVSTPIFNDCKPGTQMSLVSIGKDLLLEAKQRTNGFQEYIKCAKIRSNTASSRSSGSSAWRRA